MGHFSLSFYVHVIEKQRQTPHRYRFLCQVNQSACERSETTVTATFTFKFHTKNSIWKKLRWKISNNGYNRKYISGGKSNSACYNGNENDTIILSYLLFRCIHSINPIEKKKWKLIEVAAKATIKISPMKHHKKTAFASQLKTLDINWNWYLNRWLNRLDSIALKLFM